MTSQFTSGPESRATRALSAFVSLMRQRNPYENVEWVDDIWIVGIGRRASARAVERISFTRHVSTAAAGSRLGGGFEEEFASFVRAIVVWRAINASKRPRALSQMVLIRAFRYLYEELARDVNCQDGKVSPLHLKPVHFFAAAAVAAGRESSQSAYRVGNYLNYIANAIDRHALTVTPLRWKHGIPRPDAAGGSRHSRISKDFQQRREKLLPTDDVLYAVADISNRTDLEASDAIRQRLTDLLFCGGFRINENLTLQRDALIEETVLDDLGNPAMDATGAPLPPYMGIRFAPEKGGEAVVGIKWIPTELVPIARRAFNEILQITAEFAKDAEFAYLNPERVRLGDAWDELAGETLLTKEQVASMVGLEIQGVNSWLKLNGVPVALVSGARVCAKGDVERALRSRLGKLEVQVGEALVPLHKFLAVVPVNYFHSRKATLRGTATLVVDQNMSDYLVGRSTNGSRSKSIFERLDCRLDNGSLVEIRTHQFRHFIDSAGASGGLPELVRARWMGRKDIAQNSVYDHETGMSLAKKIRARLVDGGVVGPIADLVSELKDPVTRDAVADDLLRAVHKTMLGRCFHDWASSPCPEHEACWGCDEHLIVKGNESESAEAKRQLDETLEALAVARTELSDETYGASNWVASHERKRDELVRILGVHNDPAIPDGTIVHLQKGSA